MGGGKEGEFQALGQQGNLRYLRVSRPDGRARELATSFPGFTEGNVLKIREWIRTAAAPRHPRTTAWVQNITWEGKNFLQLSEDDIIVGLKHWGLDFDTAWFVAKDLHLATSYNRGAFDTAKVVSALLIFALIIAYGGGYSKLWAWVK